MEVARPETGDVGVICDACDFAAYGGEGVEAVREMAYLPVAVLAYYVGPEVPDYLSFSSRNGGPFPRGLEYVGKFLNVVVDVLWQWVSGV
jgi:hypothetical protein